MIYTPCISSRSTRIKMPSRISGQDLAWSQPLSPSWLSLQFELLYSALVSITQVCFFGRLKAILNKVPFGVKISFDYNKDNQV